MARTLSTSLPLTDAQRVEFPQRLEKYRQGVHDIYAKYWKEMNYTHNPGSRAAVYDGERYARIVLIEQRWADDKDRSKGSGGDQVEPYNKRTGLKEQIHSFIDKLTGDVLKPASYKAPAKQARGNIYDESNGLSRVNHFGPEYLR